MKHVGAIVSVCVVCCVMLCAGCKGAYEGALAGAVRKGDMADTEKFLGQGADVNAQWFGKTPVQVAAEEGRLDMVKFLVKKGADVNALSKFDKTALDYAEKAGKAEVVAYLATLNAKKGPGKK